MDTSPIKDPNYKVKATRPGAIAWLILAGFLGFMYVFVTTLGK
jgi:hypothetical protein